ncbi:hypothetical protein NQZ68_037247 [Dissostichus eleginoides]|nr:hypothetical protein NQZ68_037247 [Dissostichus eleginoides]
MFAVSLQFLFLLTCGVTLGQEHAVIKVIATEGKDVILPCYLSTREDLQDKLFDWKKVGQGGDTQHEVFMYDSTVYYDQYSGQSEQFKGRVSHFQNELKHGNASIVIKKTKVIDSGSYTCVFPRLQPRQEFFIELVVDLVFNDRSGENPAATPKPSVTILTATADRALLHCEVPGASLNTKAEWQSRDGNRLDAEEKRVPEKDHVLISLSVNVSRTDLYLCVVSQEDIKHRVSAQISVFISEKVEYVCEDSSSRGAMVIVGIVSFVSGALILAAVQALLVRAKRMEIRHNNGSRLQERGNIQYTNGLNHHDN